MAGSFSTPDQINSTPPSHDIGAADIGRMHRALWPPHTMEKIGYHHVIRRDGANYTSPQYATLDQILRA